MVPLSYKKKEDDFMKKNFFKSLVLGVSFSLLFSIGSFACNVENNALEEDIKYLEEVYKPPKLVGPLKKGDIPPVTQLIAKK